MTERTVADLMVERLRAWGVERIYGYSGDGINGFLEALNRAEDGPRFVQARHEENAAFMAVGHAKYGGGVGVVGPGSCATTSTTPRSPTGRRRSSISST